MRIAPSILAADFADLAAAIEPVAAVELLHLDVMDGRYVPNISFGQPVIRSLDDHWDHYFDTHLMIERPGRYVEDFADVGVDRYTVHADACEDTAAVIDAVDDAGMDAGLAINPDDDLATIEPYLDDVDVVIVMAVQPGFGGQSFTPETIERVERLDAMADVEIEVDGGIDEETGRQCANAGVDTFVIGSSLFGRDDPRQALADLREGIGIEME